MNDNEKSVPPQKKGRIATEADEMAVDAQILGVINNDDFNPDRISNDFHRTTDEIMVIIYCFFDFFGKNLPMLEKVTDISFRKNNNGYEIIRFNTQERFINAKIEN